jgi:hypothetical protein
MSTMQLRAGHFSRATFIIPVAAVVFLLFGIGPNYEVALLVGVVLVIGVFLLWRPGEPQILLFVFAFQWLQLAVGIGYSNFSGIALAEFLGNRPEAAKATVLAAFGLLALATGIRIGAGPQQASYLMMLRRSIDRVPARRWLKVHLWMWGVSILSLLLAKWIPGLSQPLLALANMKWGTFLIFTIVTFARPDGPRRVWLMLFILEFILSLGGYFSSFKYVFLYTLLAIAAVGKIRPRHLVSGLAVGIMTLVVGLYWTAVKVEYRAYVSGGQASQAIVVGYGEALDKLVDLVEQVDLTELDRAAAELAHRFTELDMFSAVLDYVPSVREHEGGKLWFDAVSRPFMPRMFFPDKAAIDESAMTNYYTGLHVAGASQGTQISMGYIAESYIDFGEIGMMGAILLFGCFIGRYSYRWLVCHPAGVGLVGCGLASSTLIQFTSLGASSAKLVGGIIVCLIVAYPILHFVMPRYMTWLYSTKA